MSSDQREPDAAQPGAEQSGAAQPGGAQSGAAADNRSLQERTAGLSGPELARAVLDAAKVKRAERNKSRRSSGDPRRYRRRGYSGPGPDPRDPQPFGALVEKLVRDRGWQQPAAEGTVFGAWEKVVGTSIAEHCRPVKLTDGELTIEAESTAWATQLRLLSGKILAKIAQEVRPSPVTRLRIHGPAAPSWRHGPLRVRGPGPGDTYG
ncbi:MAG: DciA family protein [Actinocatenispora sp.]